MSGLQKMLDERRAEEAAAAAHPCYSTKSQVATLVVEVSGDEHWLLPWQHFVFGRHRLEAGDDERLILTFVAHEVTIHGVNLGGLADEVANLRLERLRAAAGKYLKSSGAGPFVERLEVQPVRTPPHDWLNASTRPSNAAAAVGLTTIDATPKAR